jgi:hypothetical protein
VVMPPSKTPSRPVASMPPSTLPVARVVSMPPYKKT